MVRQEVQAIIEYQIKKDAELRKREEEELAREAAKKQRQAELLAQQERAQNNQVGGHLHRRGVEGRAGGLRD
jgi:hypothetical protein